MLYIKFLITKQTGQHDVSYFLNVFTDRKGHTPTLIFYVGGGPWMPYAPQM